MATPTPTADDDFWRACQNALPHDGTVWLASDEDRDQALAALIDQYGRQVVQQAKDARAREEEMN